MTDKEISSLNNDGDSDENTFFDNCATPVIAQVDSPADLKNGIIEFPNSEEYVDEP